jgi:hypothetical protein
MIGFPLGWMNLLQKFSKEEGDGRLDFHKKHQRQ